ncbi:unnamed protein product, partial [Brassica napus]
IGDYPPYIYIIEISSPQALEALNNPYRFPGLSHLIECTRQALSCFQSCLVEVVNVFANRVADQIAVSITNDGRWSSFIAHGCPSWLNDTIFAEAVNSPSLYSG